MLIDSLIHSSTQEEIPRPCAWAPEGKGSKAIQRCFWLADKIKSNGKVKLKKKNQRNKKTHHKHRVSSKKLQRVDFGKRSTEAVSLPQQHTQLDYHLIHIFPAPTF